MKHKYPVGTWIKFYFDREPVLAVIEYHAKEDNWDRHLSYHTSKGMVSEDEILEARKPAGKEIK